MKHEGGTWKVTIHIEPGRPVRLSEVNVNVTGPGANDRAIRELIEAEDIKPGLRLNHGTYERVKGSLVRVAKNEGYLEAKLTKHDLVIDRAERRANVDLEADTGERYLFGDIEIAQDVITDEAMRRLLRMHPGDPYTLDTLLRTQYVLDDTQYFSVVDIESGDPDPVTRTVPITVTAEPSRKHRYAASIGYGTDTKARGKFTWDNRTRQRGRTQVQARAARLVYRHRPHRSLRHPGDGHRAGKAGVHGHAARRRAGRHPRPSAPKSAPASRRCWAAGSGC